jgi:4a-hydroxytetrahydrobiopterin dehydratase
MKMIEREYKFKNFKESLDFVNEVADLAELRDHHPDILIKYNLVKLSFYTHTAGGVTQKDMTLAAECDQLFSK